jgi:hypothetical protein
MKHLIVLLVAAAFFLSCHKKSTPGISYEHTGYIKGPDVSMTPCGSNGYWLVVDSDPPAMVTFVDSLPAGSGINLATATFPIKVKFNMHNKPTPNPCHYVIIDAIQKID